MGRKELLMLVRAVSEIVFIAGDDMSAEEKVIRIRTLILDSFTEADEDSAPKFGAQ